MSKLSIKKSLLRIALAVLLILALFVCCFVFLFMLPLTASIARDLPDRASAERLRTHVEFLCEQQPPRNSDNPEVLEGVASYLASQLKAPGVRVSRESFQARGAAYENVVASFGPPDGETLVIGAHYDVFGEFPGADDNASGVATLLEAARLLALDPPSHRVDLVAYSLEEPPFFGSEQMGSAFHARSLEESGREVLGMVSVEMVGYFSKEQGWGNWLLDALYPTRGDFVMFVGRWQDRTLARQVKGSFCGATSLRVRSFVGPRSLTVDASDHFSYWNHGYPAVMLTDTGFIRNHNYHTARDTPDTLDYEKMALVAEGLFGAAHLAENDSTQKDRQQ